MKKFVFFALIFVTILGTMLSLVPRPFSHFVYEMDCHATAVIFCRETTVENAVCTGNGYLVTCDAANFSEQLSKCTGVDGISVKFEASYQQVEQLAKRFKLVIFSRQNLPDLTVVCGHSDRICGGILLDGKTVNIQLAYDGKTVTVGSPLILGDY